MIKKAHKYISFFFLRKATCAKQWRKF